MRHQLMITVATAALIAGTGLAAAQGNMSREAPSGGANVQQSAPSAPSAVAPSHESSEGKKASQTEEKGTMKNQRAQDGKSGAAGEKAAQGNKNIGEKSAQENRENSKTDKSKGMSSQNEKSGPAKDMKAEGQERSGNMKAEERTNSTNPAAGETRSQTVGQAGSSAKLSTEQRTRITTIIRGAHVAPVKSVNFAVSVGAHVPREVGFHPLPGEIVTIYPQWRGYEYFLVGDQIVVVDPRTLEIVAVLDA